jgi:hypothetical protein
MFILYFVSLSPLCLSVCLSVSSLLVLLYHLSFIHVLLVSLFVLLSISPSVCLFICLSFLLFVHLSVLSLCLSIRLSSFPLSPCPYVYLTLFAHSCLALCLSLQRLQVHSSITHLLLFLHSYQKKVNFEIADFNH